MKHSKSSTRCKSTTLPKLRFDDQQLTSFSGLIVFQQLFNDLALKKRLSRCFAHRQVSPIFSSASIVMLLIVSLLLGYRRLRHVKYFQGDPLVKRLLCVTRLPDVSTISRHLAAIDSESIRRVEALQQEMVLEAIAREKLARVTLDFDGSVLGTCRRAEGVAAGFNKKKKGQRSYYPLYCTVAQTAQVLAVHHRSGNVHDSNGAVDFIRQCIEMVWKTRPDAVIETRMDSAFFSEEIIALLDEYDVEYTISVPFERYTTIKCYIDERLRWRTLGKGQSFFERNLSLKSWSLPRHRFLFVRERLPIQTKGVLQLELFMPRDYNYQYKAIVTNKINKPANVVRYHEGRGTQEGLFAELKSHAAMSYVPCNTWNGNKIFMLSGILAHNLTRELQMRHLERQRGTTAKRPALWKFSRIDTLRKVVIQRAGRLIKPGGILTLSLAANDSVRENLQKYLPNIRIVA